MKKADESAQAAITKVWINKDTLGVDPYPGTNKGLDGKKTYVTHRTPGFIKKNAPKKGLS